jgi:hypothetical protein
VGPNGSTGFALSGERLLRVDLNDAEQVYHLAIKPFTDFGHLGDAEAAECCGGPVLRLAPAGQDLVGPSPQGGLQEWPEADPPDAQWTE